MGEDVHLYKVTSKADYWNDFVFQKENQRGVPQVENAYFWLTFDLHHKALEKSNFDMKKIFSVYIDTYTNLIWIMAYIYN